MEENTDDYKCTICHQIFALPMTMQCGHTFCYECIHTNYATHHNRNCPMCREHIHALPTNYNIILKRQIDRYFESQPDDEKEAYKNRIESSEAMRNEERQRRRNSNSSFVPTDLLSVFEIPELMMSDASEEDTDEINEGNDIRRNLLFGSGNMNERSSSNVTDFLSTTPFPSFPEFLSSLPHPTPPRPTSSSRRQETQHLEERQRQLQATRRNLARERTELLEREVALLRREQRLLERDRRSRSGHAVFRTRTQIPQVISRSEVILDTPRAQVHIVRTGPPGQRATSRGVRRRHARRASRDNENNRIQYNQALSNALGEIMERLLLQRASQAQQQRRGQSQAEQEPETQQQQPEPESQQEQEPQLSHQQPPPSQQQPQPSQQEPQPSQQESQGPQEGQQQEPSRRIRVQSSSRIHVQRIRRPRSSFLSPNLGFSFGPGNSTYSRVLMAVQPDASDTSEELSLSEMMQAFNNRLNPN